MLPSIGLQIQQPAACSLVSASAESAATCLIAAQNLQSRTDAETPGQSSPLGMGIVAADNVASFDSEAIAASDDHSLTVKEHVDGAQIAQPSPASSAMGALVSPQPKLQATGYVGAGHGADIKPREDGSPSCTLLDTASDVIPIEVSRICFVATWVRPYGRPHNTTFMQK